MLFLRIITFSIATSPSQRDELIDGHVYQVDETTRNGTNMFSSSSGAACNKE
jgi:hypothetical protein